jgi:hypothetical protein
MHAYKMHAHEAPAYEMLLLSRMYVFTAFRGAGLMSHFSF